MSRRLFALHAIVKRLAGLACVVGVACVVGLAAWPGAARAEDADFRQEDVARARRECPGYWSTRGDFHGCVRGTERVGFWFFYKTDDTAGRYIATKVQMAGGKMNGPFIEYFPNGRVKVQGQSKDNEEKARELCIAAEILANQETPEADKALRMQVQLKQLKQSFGSRDTKSATQQLSELEVQLLCLGPLEAKTRKACLERLQKARATL